MNSPQLKTTAIPAVRVEPELRAQMEALLRDGETLSSFVEGVVREAVERRLEDQAFYARAMAAAEGVRNGTERSYSIEEVMTRLQGKLEAALGKRQQAA